MMDSCVHLQQIRLPEFGNYSTKEMKAYVFTAEQCAYDMIVGRDWLTPHKFDISFAQLQMTFCDTTIPMRTKDGQAAYYEEV